MTYFDKVNESSKQVMDSITGIPLQKKLFNFIKNDFTGLLNSFNNSEMTFEFNDHLIDKDFMNKIIKLLEKNNFKEQRYDKKTLKEDIIELLNDEILNIKVGKKELLNALWFPMCDRELKFFTYIKNNYD